MKTHIQPNDSRKAILIQFILVFLNSVIDFIKWIAYTFLIKLKKCRRKIPTKGMSAHTKCLRTVFYFYKVFIVIVFIVFYGMYCYKLYFCITLKSKTTINLVSILYCLIEFRPSVFKKRKLPSYFFYFISVYITVNYHFTFIAFSYDISPRIANP